MRVLVVSPYIAPEGGGQGKIVWMTSKKLAERGYDVTIVSATREAPKEEDADGVRVIRLKPDYIISNTPIKLGILKDLDAIAREAKPDAVYAHTPVPYFADAANIVARKRGIPLLLHYHTGSLTKERPLLDFAAVAYRETAERFLLSSAEKVIVHNPYIRDVTLAKYAKKVVVIPPGVETARFEPPAVYPKNKLIFVGQLISAHRMKGLSHLILAMKHLRDAGSEVTLDVVGGGNMLDFYTSLAKGYGVSDRVSFHGQVPNEGIHEYYQKASVLVLPSYSNAEGFGLVILEANACGLPVIVSKVGGLAYTVEEDVNGFFAPPKDPKALAERIIDVFSDEKRLAGMRDSCRKRALKYDWEKTVDGIESCINSVLGE